MKRYSASVSHGEVEHEEDDAGMWVFREEAEQAVSDAVAAERERWKARVEEAFRDGFYSPRTYNDTVLNTAGEAWEEAKAGLLRA